MIQAPPIRYDRMRACLQAVMSDALGPDATVKWGHDSTQRDLTKGDLLSMRVIGGPNTDSAWRGRFAISSPLTISYVIDTATAGELYSLYVNHHPYRYEAQGGDGVDDIRDALLALLVGDSMSPFTAVAGGAGEIVITGDFVGALWQSHILPLPLWTVTPSSESACVVQQRQSYTTLRFECFSKGVDIWDGAHMLMSKVMAAFMQQGYQTTFDDFGVSPQARGNVLDLSAIAGDTWETRTAMDVQIGLEHVTTEPTEIIESATLTTVFRTPTGDPIFTTETTIS